MANLFSKVMEQLVYEQGRCSESGYNNPAEHFIFNLLLLFDATKQSAVLESVILLKLFSVVSLGLTLDKIYLGICQFCFLSLAEGGSDSEARNDLFKTKAGTVLCSCLCSYCLVWIGNGFILSGFPFSLPSLPFHNARTVT